MLISNNRRLRGQTTILAACMLAVSSYAAFASSGNWTNDASSVWSTAANWSSNPTVPGTAAGDVVGLTADISAARVVTLDTAATVGALKIGDPTASFFGYTLSGGSTLTFDNSGAGASLLQTTAGGAADTISTPIVLNDNLSVSNVDSLTLSGVIGGSGKGITKSGSGTLILNGSSVSTYTGATAIKGGTLIEDFANLGAATDLINNGSSLVLGGGTLQIKQKDSTTTSQTFNGTTVNANSTTALIGTQVTTGALSINLGAITHNAGGSVDFTVPAGGSITTSTGNDATGIIGGWATTGNTVSSASTGDWVANDGSGNIVTYSNYTVGTVIDGLPSSANFKNTANATCAANTTINSLVEGADIALSSGVTLTLNSGGIILWGPSKWFKNAATAAGGSEYVVSGLPTGELYVHTPNAGASDYRIWPIIKDGSVATTLIKDGPGYLRLENANTYSGGTFLNGGTLALGAPNVLGGGTLTLNAGTVLGNPTGANFASSVTNNIVVNGSIGFYLNKDGTYSGSISGSGKIDNGVSTANGSWNIVGDLSNFAGTIAHFCDNSHDNVNVGGGTANSIDCSHAKFALSGNNGQARRLSINGSGAGTFKLGDISGASGTLLMNNSLNVGYLGLNSTFGGMLQLGSGTPAVTKVGTGSLTLSGPSTYTGLTTIENGALIVGASVAASGSGPFGNASSAIALGDATTSSGNLNPSLLIGGAYTMARPVTVGNDSSATAGIYSLGGNTANNAVFSGAVTMNESLVVTQAAGGVTTISGAIGGVSGAKLAKVGAGTVILAGANTYTGSTVVSNGTLLVANTTQGNGPVTVQDGAAAGVNATTDATYWSPSSLTVGSTTGGTLQFAVFGTTHAAIMPASLTLNGTTTINISSAPLVSGVSYPLFTGYTGGTLVLGSQPGGIQGTLTINGGTVSYSVTGVSATYWTAAVDTSWDTATANWTNTFGGNKFTVGAPLIFDDSAVGSSPLLVNITITNAAPATITFNTTNKSYTVGGLAISGSTGLTKNGTNSLTLTGTNTFTGGIAISGGTLEIGDPGLLGNGNYSSGIQDGTAFKYNSTSAQTLSGTISGNGALIKANTGALTLSVSNSYAGGTVISNGTLTIATGLALGSGPVTLAGGTFQNNVAVTVTNTVNVTGNASIAVQNDNFNFNGGLVGNGTLTHVAGGTFSLYLGGDNSGFAGTFQDANSQSSITRFAAPTAGSASGHWIFNQAQNFTRTSLDFSSGTIRFGSIAGNGFLFRNGSGSATVEVGALGLNNTFSGHFVNNGSSGIINVLKVGAGTLTLAGSSGSATVAGTLTVSNGAVLLADTYVTGTIFTNVVVPDGGGAFGATSTGQQYFSPRVSAATFGSATGGTAQFDNVQFNDTPMLVATNLVLNGTTKVLLTSTNNLSIGTTYPLISYTTVTTNSGTGDFVIAAASGIQGVVTNDTSISQVTLTVTGFGPSVNTNPTNIAFTVSGNTLGLSWPADHLGWHLQMQTNSLSAGLGTNWITIPGSEAITSTNITVDPSNGSVFFRLVYP